MSLPNKQMEGSFTKKIPKHKAVYSFSPKHKPVEYVVLGEKILLDTEGVCHE